MEGFAGGVVNAVLGEFLEGEGDGAGGEGGEGGEEGETRKVTEGQDKKDAFEAEVFDDLGCAEALEKHEGKHPQEGKPAEKHLIVAAVCEKAFGLIVEVKFHDDFTEAHGQDGEGEIAKGGDFADKFPAFVEGFLEGFGVLSGAADGEVGKFDDQEDADVEQDVEEEEVFAAGLGEAAEGGLSDRHANAEKIPEKSPTGQGGKNAFALGNVEHIVGEEPKDGGEKEILLF